MQMVGLIFALGVNAYCRDLARADHRREDMVLARGRHHARQRIWLYPCFNLARGKSES